MSFILGMMVGGILGVSLLCILIVGKRADEREGWHGEGE